MAWGRTIVVFRAGGRFTLVRSSRITIVRQLLDVLYHTVELPLPINLVAAAQAKAVEPLVGTHVAKHRLHGGKPPRDHLASALTIGLASHALARRFLGTGVLAQENGHLSELASLRVA